MKLLGTKHIDAMVWAKSVDIASEGMRPGAIELTFMPESCFPLFSGNKQLPKLMNRYKSGKISPKKYGRRCGGIDFVMRIDHRYPGTAAWLFHPVWELLSPGALDLTTIHSQMVRLKGPYIKKFFNPLEWSNKTFIRNLMIKSKSDILEVAEHRSFDAFVFLLGLVREAECTSHMQQHYMSCQAMKNLFPIIAEIPQLADITDELFDYLESTFFRVVYSEPGGSDFVFLESWRNKFQELPNGQHTLQIPEPNDRKRLLQTISSLSKNVIQNN